MVTVSVWGIGVGGRSLQGEVRAGTRGNPDARAAPGRLTGSMLKLIGIAAVVVIGIVLLGWLTWRAYYGEFSSGYVAPIENFGLYWHFVDIVWLFLFPLLYLINRHPAH